MPQRSIEVEHHGQMLRGTAYLPEPSGRFPAVLLLHGFTGDRIEAGFLFVRLARALSGRGVAAVTFDFLHSGESDGSFDRMLASGELADALRMHHWLGGQLFADRSRLGLIGFSLGGLLAACASARVGPGGLKALALLAPTTVRNLCRYAGDRDGCAPAGGGPVTIGPHTLHRRFFEDLRTLDPLADAARYPRPTLLVQGTADNAVPPAVSQEYAARMRQYGVPLTEETIEGADHTFSKGPWQAEVIERVSKWMAETL